MKDKSTRERVWEIDSLTDRRRIREPDRQKIKPLSVDKKISTGRRMDPKRNVLVSIRLDLQSYDIWSRGLLLIRLSPRLFAPWGFCVRSWQPPGLYPCGIFLCVFLLSSGNCFSVVTVKSCYLSVCFTRSQWFYPATAFSLFDDVILAWSFKRAVLFRHASVVCTYVRVRYITYDSEFCFLGFIYVCIFLLI